MKVLLVDDSAFQRRRIREWLSEAGFETAEAEDGAEALEKIPIDKPDLIIMDLLMPRMDGFTLMRNLADQGSVIPVIVHSANVQQASKDRCEKLGARMFVNKAGKSDALLGAIESVFGAPSQ